jgi:hypothetical protein
MAEHLQVIVPGDNGIPSCLFKPGIKPGPSMAGFFNTCLHPAFAFRSILVASHDFHCTCKSEFRHPKGKSSRDG